MAEWISVKDKLPSDGETVLICRLFSYASLTRASIRIASYTKNLHKLDEYDFPRKKYNRGGFYNNDSEWGFYEERDVTHWMPLPPIPKEYEDG